MRNLLIILSIIVSVPCANAQIQGKYLGDETALYAETKQVNQFFRRFNNEEGKDGVKYSKTDKRYRSLSYRKNYLEILFDGQSNAISAVQKEAFITQVNQATNPVFLNFHGDDWFAEVNATFEFKGKQENATLFLKLEQENKGYKWVLANAWFEPFAQLFTKAAPDNKNFLHPMSHELDFMNLVKVFKNKAKVEDYTAKDYAPDYLSIFLYEFKKSNLNFITVKDVKFHFFQVDGWYFELSEFNRSGLNTGWLISNLVQLPKEQKEVFVKYIYRQ